MSSPRRSSSQYTVDIAPLVSAVLIMGTILVLVHNLHLPSLGEHLLQAVAVVLLYRYFWLRIRVS